MFCEAEIAPLIGIRKKAERFGIEIEVEGRNLPVGVVGWKQTMDGSLRGDENVEYVLRTVSSLENVKKYLDNLKKAYDENNSVIDETIRAGVHVHLNVTDLNVRQMFNFITVYYIFEDFLCQFCGPERSGNHFCLRVSDAMAPIFSLKYALERKNFTVLSNDNLRYAALNFTSLFRHGSLEFRAMRSTADLDEVYKWVCILNELFETTTKNYHESPSEIPRMFSGDGAELFVNTFLPTYGKELILDTPGYELTLRDSLRNCQPFIYATDWS